MTIPSWLNEVHALHASVFSLLYLWCLRWCAFHSMTFWADWPHSLALDICVVWIGVMTVNFVLWFCWWFPCTRSSPASGVSFVSWEYCWFRRVWLFFLVVREWCIVGQNSEILGVILQRLKTYLLLLRVGGMVRSKKNWRMSFILGASKPFR